MRNTITVMNAKGGVGKSTLVLALAETLANDHGKKVLVIDSDAQASVSHMLMRQQDLEFAQARGRTFVDFLIEAVLKQSPTSWRSFVVGGVSDIDDARSIDLLPSDTHLTLFEREVSKSDREVWLRRTIGALLTEARSLYDLVLIDSAPGLSVLTESWLREADFYLSPDAPRLHLHPRPEIPRRVPPARPSHGLCRVPRRRHQHEGRARARGCGVRGLAAQGGRAPLLRPSHPPGGRAAVSDALCRAGPLLLGEVSRPDRGEPAPADCRVAGLAVARRHRRASARTQVARAD